MKNFRLWIAVVGAGLVLGGCADQTVPLDQAHPFGWVKAHGSDAAAGGRAERCQTCHGAQLEGGTVGVACRSCHLEGAPFRIHPAAWTDPAISHRRFAASWSWTGCATSACHGTTLRGGHGSGETGPSCFTADSAGCHTDGPPAPESHQGGTFSDPAEHGPVARGLLLPSGELDPASTQVYCRNCHGRPASGFEGGYVASPAILARDVACSACHPDAKAHPTDWQGGDDTGPYLSSHRAVPRAAIAGACALCHRTGGPGAGPVAEAPSCFSSRFTNAGGNSTGCHAGGPGTAPHAIPFADPALHGPEAKNAQVFCQTCHGTSGTPSFAGGIADTACSQTSCHPAARAHPTRWQGNDDTTPDYLSSHRTIREATAAEGCALCHKTDGAGAGPLAAAPSCFSASFTNADRSTSGCHAEGPGTPPHAVPFTDPADHGPDAKADLTFCQGCHGTTGTTAFDGGFTGVACSSCHPDAGAHPTDWQGSNDTSPEYLAAHYTAGSLDTACAICHNVTAVGPGPNPDAPSCFSANFSNSAGSASSCHADGPGAPHALGVAWTAPGGHGADGKQRLLYCQGCHGTPETRSFDGGVAGTSCATCHPDAKAHPTNWQGTNDSSTEYLATHRSVVNWGVDCALCHDTAEGRTDPSNPGPSCFSPEYTNANGLRDGCHATGPGPGHVLPFRDPTLHGALAKSDLTYCQHCHAEPFNGGPGSNPRFNVLLGSLDDGAGHTGCEFCHQARTAHPVPWAQDRVADHQEFGNKEQACTLCHGANLLGSGDTPAGVGPTCRACHTFGFPVPTGLAPTPFLTCMSCHNVPPDGILPAGSDAADGGVRPNRAGAHATHDALPHVARVCNTCHDGAGTGTARHFDPDAPADLGFLSVYNAKGGTAVGNANGTCSNVSCHGGRDTPPWLTGGIDVGTDCSSCHEAGTAEGSPEANSYYSGNHGSHAEAGGHAEAKGFSLTCSACHDAAALAPGHFAGLDTPAFEGTPVGTLRSELGYDTTDPAAPTCSVGAGGPLAGAGCHTDTRTWGGVPHNVGPQWLLPGEHAAAAIGGVLNCLACHVESGAGGVSPACGQCHQLSAPKGDAGRCDSCHTFSAANTSAPTGATWPNRRGRHTNPGDHNTRVCSDCHSGSGSGSLSHYDSLAPADISPPAGESITFSQSDTQVTCTGVCHRQDHERRRWY